MTDETAPATLIHAAQTGVVLLLAAAVLWVVVWYMREIRR